MRRRDIRAKPHRLPIAYYYGNIRAYFTVCVEDRKRLFTSDEVVGAFVQMLADSSAEFTSRVEIYCFMPDHLHTILQGTQPTSNPKLAMDKFKHQAGMWLEDRMPQIRLQGDYYDSKIYGYENWRNRVVYIAANPIRGGLVANPLDYPFTGCLDGDLQELLLNCRWSED